MWVIPFIGPEQESPNGNSHLNVRTKLHKPEGTCGGHLLENDSAEEEPQCPAMILSIHLADNILENFSPPLRNAKVNSSLLAKPVKLEQVLPSPANDPERPSSSITPTLRVAELYLSLNLKPGPGITLTCIWFL